LILEISETVFAGFCGKNSIGTYKESLFSAPIADVLDWKRGSVVSLQWVF